jgi:Sec-independent protein secretion pathway component TatC
MLLFGTVSDLGKSAALLFMVISWSGVPLLVFAFHNKEILKVELLLGIAYAIVALVPICIYAIWLISEGVRLNLKESALALGPTIISLILFIIILALARIAVNEKKY